MGFTVRRPVARTLLGALVVCAVALDPSPASAGPGDPERMSVAQGGGEADAESVNATVSTDGRFVAFDSPATDLVSLDLNGSFDVFVRDRQAGTLVRASVSSGEAEGNADSYSNFSAASAISADGRYVALYSDATNLVAGDSNGTSDVFVRDLTGGTTIRASVGAGGAQTNGASEDPALSSDGRWVAYDSTATNLVTGDTNGARDVFLYDWQGGATQRVSVASGGTQANGPSSFASVSGDGRFVAFNSSATDLVAGDTNGAADVFVRDVVAGTTVRASVSNAGAQGGSGSFNASISSDGRLVAFESGASNLVGGDTNGTSDVFVRDLVGATTMRASVGSAGAQGNGDSVLPAISADGTAVGFDSDASTLVAGDTNGLTDVFLRRLTTGVTTRVSSPPGGQANGGSFGATVASAGALIAFESVASNLVPGDTNQTSDVFAVAPDTTAPGAPTITSPAEGAQTSAASIPVTGTAGGGVGVRVYEGTTQLAETQADATGAWSVPIPFVEGAHTITARALDAGGTPGPASAPRSFTVDRTPPAAPAITTPAQGATVVTASVNVGGTAEPLATVRVFEGSTQLGQGQAGAGGAWSIAISLPNGPHSLTARATDRAGNVGPASAVRSFVVDAPAPPPPTIQHPVAGSLHPSLVGFDGSAPGAQEVRLYEGGVEIARVPSSGGTWSLQAALASGAHTVTARSVANGVVGSPSAPRSFTVDASPPLVAFTTLAGDDTIDIAFPGRPIGGTASDSKPGDGGVARLAVTYRDVTGAVVAEADASCTGCPGSNVTWSHAPDVLPGLYSVTVRAYDVVGNSLARGLAVLVI